MKLLPLLVLSLCMAGCASPGVNPSQPSPNSGYVDFYSESLDSLSWDITRIEEQTGKLKLVSSKLEPPEYGILRLPLTPGSHKLRVAFLDRVVTHPAEIEVQITEGAVTPVRVGLTQTGTAVVQSKERTYGPTAYGRYGRRSEIRTEETVAHVVSAIPQTAVPYAPKDRMPYSR